MLLLWTPNFTVFAENIAMDFGVGIDDFIEVILPNLEKIPDLVISHEGCQILCSISESKDKIRQHIENKHQIFIIENTDEMTIFITNVTHKNSSKACIYKVYKNKEYFVTFVLKPNDDTLYIFDPGINLKTYSLKHKLPVGFDSLVSNFKLKWVDCTRANGNSSLCHAFVNAKLMIWGTNTFKQDNDLSKFIENFLDFEIVSNENINKMIASVFLLVVDDVQTSNNDILCLDRQNRIDKLIKKSVKRGETLQITTEMIKEIHKSLDSREQAFIQTTFVEHCCSQYIQKLDNYFKHHRAQITGNPDAFILKIESVNKLSAICEPFCKIHHYEMLINLQESGLMNKACEMELLEHIRNCSLKFLISQIRFLEKEKQFIGLFDAYLTHCFVYNTALFEDIEDKLVQVNQDTFAKIIFSFLKTCTEKQFEPLKRLADQLSNDTQSISSFNSYWNSLVLFYRCCSSKFLLDTTSLCSDMFKKQLFSSWLRRSQILSKESIDNQQNGILRIESHYLRLSDILDQIKEQVITDTYQVELYVSKIIVIDTSLTFPGINLVLLSPEIHIEGDQQLDLSGRHGENEFKYNKAQSGTLSGSDGENGKHGCHGQSGGNVFIVTDKIINPGKLFIMSNGGDGQNAQNGGDGIDGNSGTNGIGLSKNEFKTRFPRLGYFYSTNLKTIRMNISNIKIEGETYYEGETREGNKIIFGFYENYNNVITGTIKSIFGYDTVLSYCIVYGTDGTQGQKGGNGGRGGNAGLGGYCGTVCVMDFQRDIFDIKQSCQKGCDGKNGLDGQCGKGGKNGKKGTDIAQLDSNTFTQPEQYDGHLSIEYKLVSRFNVWCKKNEGYVEFSKNNPSTTCQISGQLNENKTEKQIDRVRSRPVLKDDILEHFTCAFENTNSILFNLQVEKIHKLKTKSDEALESLLEMKNEEQIKVKSLLFQSIDKNVTNFNFTLKVNEAQQSEQFPCKLSVSSVLNDIRSLLEVGDSRKRGDNMSFQALQNILNDIAEILPMTDFKRLQLIELFKFHEFVDSTCSTDQSKCVTEKQILEKSNTDLGQYLLMKYRIKLAGLAIYKIENFSISWIKQQNGSRNDLQLIEIQLHSISLKQKMEMVVGIQAFQTFQETEEFIQNKEDEFYLILKDIDFFQDRIDDTISLFEFECTKPDDNTLSAISDGNNEIQKEQFLSEDLDEDCIHISTENKNTEPVIQHKCGDLIKTLKQCVPLEFFRLIDKCQYLLHDDVPELIKILGSRFTQEGVKIKYEHFRWLMICLFEEIDIYGLSPFIIMFATKAQDIWLTCYTALSLNTFLSLPYADEIELSRKISQYKNSDFILFLSRQLMEGGNTDNLTPAIIFNILDMVQHICLDSTEYWNLEHMPISDWLHRLQWLNTLLLLKNINTDISLNERDFATVVFYVSELKIKLGSAVTESLIDIVLEKSEVVYEHFLELLQNLHLGKWKLNEKSLCILKSNTSRYWSVQLHDMFVSCKNRTLNDLIKLIQHDDNEEIVDLKHIQTIVECAISAQKNRSKIVPAIQRFVSDFDKDDIKNWTRVFNTNRKELMLTYLPEVLAVLKRGVFLTKQIKLRDTQTLSIILFLFAGNVGQLQQIFTGEGKSLIIVVLSIIKVLSGENVDVVTSSSVLAERDAEINVDLYDLFDVSVGHNCSDKLQERKRSYVKSKVIYGESGAFQRDTLLHEFYDEDIGIGSRQKGFIIVDEVDSMLLDKGQNVLYLSHDIPGMETLESVYVHIWNFVNGHTGTENDIELVHKCMVNAMFHTISIDDIDGILKNQGFTTISACHIHRLLVGSGIINDKGVIIKTVELMNDHLDLGSHISVFPPKLTDSISCCLKDKVRQGISVEVPQFLKTFVNRHLREWIENAFKAKYMEQNDHYIIDIDRSDASYKSAPNIIIMDKDTGTEQYHSQWSNGLHQFLQLKHGCRFSLEGLKAVFMSNVTFFNSYNAKLYGLTGTLGSAVERELLKSLYNVHYLTIPPFQPSQFIEKVPVMCTTGTNWLDTIKTEALQIIRQGRPVLLICKSVGEVEKFEKILHHRKDVFVYKRSYEPLVVGTKDEINQACIVIATNLAGRGTDLKISDRVNKLGGLHVCLTYLPKNCRTEEQAFGRTARKGQNGSGQIIFCYNTNTMDSGQDEMQKIIKIKIQRNFDEELNVFRIKTHFTTVINYEELLFYKFSQEYKRLSGKVRVELKDENNIVNVILQNILHEWTLSLDQAIRDKCDSIDENVSKEDNDISKLKKKMNENFTRDSLDSFVSIPAQKIKLAHCYMDNGNYEQANKIFNNIIEKEEYCSEIAHYYIGYCMTKMSNQFISETFMSHMQNTERILRMRCQELSLFVGFINLIGENYKNNQKSFLMANDYETQKRDMIVLYSTFLNSVQQICGQEVTTRLIEMHTINEIESYHIYKELENSGIIEKSHKNNNVDIKNKNTNDAFQLFWNEIKETLDNSVECVCADTFKGILPSREHFWELMKDAGLLTKESCYVVLDKKLLSQLCVPDIYKSHFFNLKPSNDFPKSFSDQSSTDFMCCWISLSDDHIQDILNENVTVIDMDHFLQTLGPIHLWASLFEKSVLGVYKRGCFEYSTNCQLARLDEIREDTFTEINGISSSSSKEIYNDLKNRGIISKQDRAKLLLTELTKENVNLQCYLRYETEIINLIDKHCTYRLALYEILEHGSFTLASNPHRMLFEDLINEGLITRSKVNCSLSYQQIENKVKTTFGGDISKDRLENICADFGTDVDNVWQTLVSMKWIECISETEAFIKCDMDTLSLHRLQSTNIRTMEPVLNLYFRSLLRIKNETKGLSDSLFSMQSDLSKFEKFQSNLKSLDKFIDSEMVHQMSYELTIFHNIGFNNVVTIVEKSSTIGNLLRAGAIGLIGMCEITLAAVVEIFTTGVGTFIAAGLMSGGMDSIMFAVESAFAGNCTWEDFLQCKKTSIALSVLTNGVGSFLARGAKFSRYGYKIGGEFLQNVSGRKLLKQAGPMVVMKAVGVRIAKKVTESTAVGLSNCVIDHILRNKLDDFLTNITNIVIRSVATEIDNNSELRDTLRKLCKSIGIERANLVINKINRDVLFESSENHDLLKNIVENFSKLNHVIAGGLGVSLKKISKSNVKVTGYGNVSNVLNNIALTVSTANNLKDILEAEGNFLYRAQECIQQELNNLQCNLHLEMTDKDTEDFCEERLTVWKSHVTQIVKNKINVDIFRPAMQSVFRHVMFKTVESIKKLYENYKTSNLKRLFLRAQESRNSERKHLCDTGVEFVDKCLQNIIDEKYNNVLMELLVKTRDPDLFADIIREGVPVGIHCVQAVAEILGRPIEITTIGGDDTIIMPQAFTPTEYSSDSEPIVLYFQVGRDGQTGHFFNPESLSEHESNGHFDCLFQAVNSQTSENINRNQIADTIQSNVVIRSRINRGIHEHFMNKGASGGSKQIFFSLCRRCLRFILRWAPVAGQQLKEVLKKETKISRVISNLVKIKRVLESKVKKKITKTEFIINRLIELYDLANEIECHNGLLSDETLPQTFSVETGSIETSIEENTKQQCSSEASLQKSQIDLKQKLETLNSYLRPGLDQKFRDKAMLAQFAIKKTGCDELLQYMYLDKWIKMADTLEPAKYKNHQYNIIDLFFNLRVNTTYVNWIYTDQYGITSIQGHTNSLFDYKIEGQLSGYRTYGQHSFHQKRSDSALTSKSTIELVCKSVKSHLDNTLTGKELMKMNIEKPVFTTNGHDLSNMEDRQKHAKGIDRERAKLSLITQKLDPTFSNNNEMNSDKYIERLKNDIEELDFTSLLKTVREPAPYD